MKIIVTGSAGFIGSHLVGLLAKDAQNQIVGIDNLNPSYGSKWSNFRMKSQSELDNFEFRNLDLVHMSPIELGEIFRGAHSVIHLAAWPGVRTSQRIPHEYSKSNLTGFGNVLEAVRLSEPSQFLFASSSSIYGDLGSNGPVRESDATGKNVKSYYAATKWANEVLAQSHQAITKVPTAALRFFTVYGEDGRPDMAYWTFLEKIRNSEAIDLYGKTGGSRNFTYIKDAVEIIRRIVSIDLEGFSALNIAAGQPIETIDFVNTIASIANRPLNINIIERPGVDVEKTWADLTKLNQLIGQVAPTSIEVGLNNFYNWFEKNGLK
jgi:UDP-glucuronate 4-epimerase